MLLQRLRQRSGGRDRGRGPGGRRRSLSAGGPAGEGGSAAPAALAQGLAVALGEGLPDGFGGGVPPAFLLSQSFLMSAITAVASRMPPA